ncbi:ParB N-terminal domain-containing protein [Leptospira kirschneri]|uniref:chromosome partitioning protein ParB n=1 Tax=Leptospira kirschneri TaxID=29507 RepID=UPI0021C757A2|nr:chromosome partitioning protein ParB [Leptospira kirschneri]UML80572.1 chromosome partitioning protein ParB [Leptospira kirschneri]
MKVEKKSKETSSKVSLEEKAKEWMDAQESSPRPGSTFGKQYIPKGVTLNPIVKMVSPSSLKPNPRNDFDPLSEEEYTSLKENIALNGILDALTAKKDGTLVTGENRYRIALELKEHEDEGVRRRVESIPVRYYMNELTAEEEYDILEGDNLFRRHLTAEQRKERLKKRILRKYKDELVQDNRGGDRKSEASKEEEKSKEEQSFSPEKQTDPLLEMGLGRVGEVGTLEEQENEGVEQKSKVQGELLIGHSGKDLAKRVSEKENIPVGTAKKYIAELRKELKTKDPKSSKKEEKSTKKEEGKKSRRQLVKAKVKEFQKKYGKMSYDQKEAALERLLNSLRKIRKQQDELHKKTMELGSKDSELVELISSVGQQKRIWNLKV